MTEAERTSEKTGNVRIDATRGRRFWGDSATAAHAVNQPIAKTKMKTPKKKWTAAESAAPHARRTKSGRKLNRRMNATDIPLRIAKKLSKSRSDGWRQRACPHGTE